MRTTFLVTRNDSQCARKDLQCSVVRRRESHHRGPLQIFYIITSVPSDRVVLSSEHVHGIVQVQRLSLCTQGNVLPTKKPIEMVMPQFVYDRLRKSGVVWQQMSMEEKNALLTVSVQELREKAVAQSSSELGASPASSEKQRIC
jgi:hypothetical protein